jgi:chitin disaccharide deacetylase
MKLILCADDFGQSEAIDLAIIKLIEMNRLTATSCMTLSPRWAEAAKRLTPSIKAKASIGLHLDFTHFGEAIPHQKLVLLSLSRQLSNNVLSNSIHYQLDRFESSLGCPPDYVDGHQHVHQLPQIRECLFEVLLKRYPQSLPWLRLAKPPISDGFKGLIIRALGSGPFEKQAKKLGFVCSGALLGVYGFEGSSKDYLARFKGWLKQAKAYRDTPLLMCHPALEISQTDEDVIYQARLREFLLQKRPNPAQY